MYLGKLQFYNTMERLAVFPGYERTSSLFRIWMDGSFPMQLGKLQFLNEVERLAIFPGNRRTSSFFPSGCADPSAPPWTKLTINWRKCGAWQILGSIMRNNSAVMTHGMGATLWVDVCWLPSEWLIGVRSHWGNLSLIKDRLLNIEMSWWDFHTKNTGGQSKPSFPSTSI